MVLIVLSYVPAQTGPVVTRWVGGAFARQGSVAASVENGVARAFFKLMNGGILHDCEVFPSEGKQKPKLEIQNKHLSFWPGRLSDRNSLSSQYNVSWLCCWLFRNFILL